MSDLKARIYKAHPEWAILPDRPWYAVMPPDDDTDTAWSVVGGPYETQADALDALCRQLRLDGAS